MRPMKSRFCEHHSGKYDNKEWTLVVGERYHIEGNYLLMVENLCDLTHIPYLHGQTFQFPE